MFQVIAATDFSGTSKNAVRYGSSLLKYLEGSLTILHYYADVRATGHFKSMVAIMKAEAHREMEELIEEVQEQRQWSGNLESKVIKGDLVDGLRQLNKHPTSLLIIGTQGAGRVTGMMFGSMARAIVNKVQMPTLIVPEQCQFREIKNLIVANDGMMSENNFEFLTLLGGTLKAHLHFVHIGEQPIDQQSQEQYELSLSNCSYSFHNVSSKDILSGINEFAEFKKGDMVIMSKRRQNFLQSLFSSSHTRGELTYTKLPLLVLHRDL